MNSKWSLRNPQANNAKNSGNATALSPKSRYCFKVCDHKGVRCNYELVTVELMIISEVNEHFPYNLLKAAR